MRGILAILGILAYLAAFFGTLVSLAFFWLRQYYIARRKGYSAAVAGSLIGGAALLSVILLLAAAVVSDNQHWSNVETTFALIAAVLTPLLGTALVVLTLPRRNARHAGARSMPFLWSTTMRWIERGLYLSGGAIVVAAVLSGWWWFGDSRLPGRLVSFGMGLIGLPALFAYYRTRAKAPSLAAAANADARAPVLYLRAFYQESDPFTWGPKRDMARYTSAPISEQAFTIPVTFEQYLGPAISRAIGPFVALGNPEDALPPEGAARAYAGDDEWQQQFSTLGRTAAAIVMEVSRSENLRWEMTAIHSRGWSEKLFVITRPVPKSKSLFCRWFYAMLRAAKGVRAPRWSDFAAELAHAGFRIAITNPGPGAVVAFDRDGTAETIARNASEPREFVSAIETRLDAVRANAGGEVRVTALTVEHELGT